MEDIRHSWFIVLPYRVIQDKQVPWSAKIMLGEIYALLSVESPYCYATNKHFQHFMKLSDTTIDTNLAKLKEREYIKVEIDKKNGNRRKIWINDSMYFIKARKLKDPIPENLATSPSLLASTIKEQNNNKNIYSGQENARFYTAIVELYIKHFIKDPTLLLKQDKCKLYSQAKRLCERTRNIALIEEGMIWLANKKFDFKPAISTLDKMWITFIEQRGDSNEPVRFYYKGERTT